MNEGNQGQDEYRSAWLGGEAHVRFHNGRSLWSRLLVNRQRAALAIAFLAGAAIGGGAAALACAKRSSDDE
jgi:hypothetical protein